MIKKFKISLYLKNISCVCSNPHCWKRNLMHGLFDNNVKDLAACQASRSSSIQRRFYQCSASQGSEANQSRCSTCPHTKTDSAA